MLARKDIYYGTWFGLAYSEDKFKDACREVGVMAKLRHDNIVCIDDFKVFSEKQTMSIYMECCDSSVEALVRNLQSSG